LAVRGDQRIVVTNDSFQIARGNQLLVSIPYTEIAKAGMKIRLWFGAEGDDGPPDRFCILLKPGSKGVIIRERNPLCALTPWKGWSYVTRFSYAQSTSIILKRLNEKIGHSASVRRST
jgi:hypothetical protein